MPLNNNLVQGGEVNVRSAQRMCRCLVGSKLMPGILIFWKKLKNDDPKKGCYCGHRASCEEGVMRKILCGGKNNLPVEQETCGRFNPSFNRKNHAMEE